MPTAQTGAVPLLAPAGSAGAASPIAPPGPVPSSSASTFIPGIADSALIAPAMTLISGLIAICVALIVAWVTIRSNRAMARLKATLDLIEKSESSDYYLRINRSFSQVRREGLFDRLDNPMTAWAQVLRTDVGAYLNHYELVALGIENAILDEAMYKAWMAGPFVRDWNAAADWLQRERWRRGSDGGMTYRASLYGSYQRIALRWSPTARNLVAGVPPIAPPADAPIELGDEPLPDTGPSESTRA